MSSPHDALFKHVFSQPEHAASELRAMAESPSADPALASVPSAEAGPIDRETSAFERRARRWFDSPGECRRIEHFAAVVQSNRVDLARAERTLAEMHPEMLSTWQRRVIAARTLEPPPERPAPRRRKRS